MVRFSREAIRGTKIVDISQAKAHLITQAAVYKENEKDKWKWFWEAFIRHKEKLGLLEYDLHWKKYMNKKEFYRRIKVLIETREKSIYVHFDHENKIFVTPKEIFESASFLSPSYSYIFLDWRARVTP